MRKSILVIFSVCMLSGCTPAVLQIDDVEKKSSEPELVQENTRWFWGLSGSEVYAVDKVCVGRGLNSIETREDGINGILNFFTGGIYMPATYAFYCNK